MDIGIILKAPKKFVIIGIIVAREISTACLEKRPAFFFVYLNKIIIETANNIYV